MLTGNSLSYAQESMENLNLEIMNNDFDTYYFTIDSLKAQLSMSAFERENMRLSGYIAQDRKDDVEQQLSMMMNMRIKKIRNWRFMSVLFIIIYS